MNSRLFRNESGRVGIHDFRAQSVVARFNLPAPCERAELFVLASQASSEVTALRVCVGAQEYSLDAPKDTRTGWLRSSLAATVLRLGENVIGIPAQPGWSFALEGAEPVVRLRVGDQHEDERKFPRYGDAAIEAGRDEWLALLPASLQTVRDRWQWSWNLAGWLAAAWKYSNGEDGDVYAPWDARTILRWGRAGRDESNNKPIAMCVHYAVCFVQFCVAMGVPARAVVLSPALTSSKGHFVAEVWLEEFASWAMIDPNLHLCFRDRSTRRPLAVAELFARRSELEALAQFGEGYEAQRTRMGDFAKSQCLSGEVYRLWGVWARHDWIENPQWAPPAHGAVPYCETDILWCGSNEEVEQELAMFPHFLNPQELAKPPLP